jgi:hypothetical protein
MDHETNQDFVLEILNDVQGKFPIFPNYLTDHSKKCIKGKL